MKFHDRSGRCARYRIGDVISPGVAPAAASLRVPIDRRLAWAGSAGCWARCKVLADGRSAVLLKYTTTTHHPPNPPPDLHAPRSPDQQEEVNCLCTRQTAAQQVYGPSCALSLQGS